MEKHTLRLTLRTLLAYLDDTLDSADSRLIGQKLAENPGAQEIVDRIQKLIRRRGIAVPPFTADGTPNDPVVMASYLSDTLHGDRVGQFEQLCLDSDVLLAEVAACHQILTVVLSQPMRVPATARRRMYALVKGRESIPNRPPNPAIAPVGGVPAEETFEVEQDDSDAALLLGMTAYSRSESWGRRLAKVGAAVGLAAAAVIAVWLALPPLKPTTPDSPVELALAPVPATRTTLPTAATTPTPPTDRTVPPATTPELAPMPKVPEPKEPMPPKKDNNPKKENPPKDDGARVPAPPSAERVRIGSLVGDGSMLLHQADANAAWLRVGPTDTQVSSAETLMALPGFKGTIALDNGIDVELKGNLPELVPAPLLWASVTLHDPEPPFDADITVHAGRIYLKTDKPDGAKIRLRFAGSEVWDLTLPNDTADAAFEIVTTATPGAGIEPPQTTAGLAVLAGTASLKVRYKDFPKLEAGEVLSWDSKGAGLDGPRKLPEEGTAYFSRFQTYADAAPARAALTAVGNFRNRLTDPTRVKVVFAEALSDSGPPSLASVTAARIAVLAQAAMGELPTLLDAADDSNRAYVREAAIYGLRAALAADPGAPAEFRTLLLEKARLTEDQADTVLRLLRGLTDFDKKNPATLDQLVELLNSNKVIVRELAFVMLTEVDPESRSNRNLSSFDAGAANENREATVKAWQRRIEELKKKSAEPAEKK